MQKIAHFVAYIALGLSILLSACNSSDNNTKYISKDAVGVVCINTMELGKKVAWNVLSGSPILDEILNKSKDTGKFDIQQTGIDPLNHFFGYAVADQRLPGKSRMMVILPLKDAEKFKQFISSQFKDALFEAKDKLHFAYIGDYAALGWDKKTAIIAFSSPGVYEQGWDESTAKPATADNRITILTEEIQKTFVLPGDQSLARNQTFSNLMKKNHDISFWLNYESLSNSLPQEVIGTAGAVMASQKKLLKDAYLTASIDFEKGKIVGDAAYYYNPSMKAIATALAPKSANNDLLKKIPGKQMNLLMSYHLNPKGLKNLMDTMGVLPMVNLGLQQVELSLDDILNAFTGDFLLSVTDFAVTTESKSYTMGGSSVNYTSPVPSFKAILSFRVQDKAAFNKILQVGRNQGLLHAVSTNLYQAGPYVSVATDNNYVAISNDSVVASAYLNTHNASWKIPSVVSNSPYGFYTDIKNSIQSIPLDLLYGKEDTTVFTEGRKLIESISAYGGKVENDCTTFHFEATFQNKNENSLMQLISFSQKVAEAERKAPDNYEDVIPESDTAEEATEEPVP